MADNRKAEELNSRLVSITKKYKGSLVNVSSLDNNITAIKDLVLKSYECGVLSAYRPLTEYEMAELSKNEKDEIANAYYAVLDGKEYFLTYKPQVDKKCNRGSKLEHVNRSTPFVEALLTKISGEYSFLYCKSRVDENCVRSFVKPAMHKGFHCGEGVTVKEGGSQKYELFFLIECLDNIDAAENLSNIIDSVLLDVHSNETGDFFSGMTYARLDRDDDSDILGVPDIDENTKNNLNKLITTVREQPSSRRKILDFLAQSEGGALNRYFTRRDSVFKNAYIDEYSALNSTITCRLLPIGVFLNDIETYTITYNISDSSGESVKYAAIINPTVKTPVHICPSCGKQLLDGTEMVLAGQPGGKTVCCTACAVKCNEPMCYQWLKIADVCCACEKPYCANHSFACESGEKICHACGEVLRDKLTNSPISPKEAAARGMAENFIYFKVHDLLEKGNVQLRLKKEFAGIDLYKKTDCVKCKDPEGGYKFYLKTETGICAECGESFYKPLLKATAQKTLLCPAHRYACSCGNIVNIKDTVKCAAQDCEVRFCPECKKVIVNNTDFDTGLKTLEKSKESPFVFEDATYCFKHTNLCKSCGKLVPMKDLTMCTSCGGYFCKTCGGGTMCPICQDAVKANSENYKEISSKTRMLRLNTLPVHKKFFGKVAVLEDKVHILYVDTSDYKNQKRLYNKLTGKFKTLIHL